MANQQSDIGYPVIVTPRANGYELSIRELLVTVRADTVSEGWKLLIKRRQEVMEWAVAAGLFDELPPPQPLPPLVSQAD